MNTALIQSIKQSQNDSTLLKHEQIISGILKAIESGDLKKDDFLPSVNVSVEKLGIARKTLVKAYDELKKRGIIQSKKRLGYYIVSTRTEQKRKVMLLLNTFNSYHQVMYEAFINKLGNDVQVDIFFHHGNAEVFKTLVDANAGRYTHYIITPFEDPLVKKTLKNLDKKDILILSRPNYEDISDSFITQNYTGEFESALNKALPELRKYKGFFFIFSPVTNPPKELKETFIHFCKKNSLKYDISSRLQDGMMKAHAAFLLLEDNDVVDVIIKSRNKKLKPGSDIGIISYNESPVKEVMGDGITVISVDYVQMGTMAAEWVVSNRPVRIKMSTKLIKRNSI